MLFAPIASEQCEEAPHFQGSAKVRKRPAAQAGPPANAGVADPGSAEGGIGGAAGSGEGNGVAFTPSKHFAGPL